MHLVSPKRTHATYSDLLHISKASREKYERNILPVELLIRICRLDLQVGDKIAWASSESVGWTFKLVTKSPGPVSDQGVFESRR